MNRRLLEALASLALVGASWWTMLPAHTRRRYRMTLSRSLATSTELTARHLGRAGMREELDGRTDTALSLYRAAHRLMTTLHAGAQRAYDRARDIAP